MTEFEVYAQGSIAQIPILAYEVLLTILFIGVAVALFTPRAQKVQKISMLMLVEWVIFIYCSAVVFRESREVSSIKLLPLWSYFDYDENSYLKEMAAINILNVVMFVPVGFLMKCSFRNMTWKQVLLLSFILSSSVELLQLVFCKGLCELDDIIHNVFGSMIGYLAVHVILKLK